MKKDTFYFQWHITNLCNLRCKHCYQDDFSSDNELQFPQLKIVANNIFNTLKMWNKDALITITGGEPLVKKETFALLGHLNNSEVVKELNIITNATLFDKKTVDGLKYIPKLKRVKFSLEGLTEESNDFIRGKGSFKRIMNTLELLRAQDHVKIHLMFTLMKSNMKDIPKLFSFCIKNGIQGVILERFIPIGEGKQIKDEVLSSEDWREVANLLIEFCQLNIEEKDILSQRAFWIKFIEGSHPEVLGAPCTVSCDGLCVMPDATVYPCRRFNLPIGNLLKEKLDDIWSNSKVLNAVKEKKNLKGKCSSCVINDCRGCRALAYALTDDYLAEDLQCWYNG